MTLELEAIKLSKDGTMAITFEATYENGVLKPAHPLPLKENEQVRVTVEPKTSRAERTAGMIPWAGDPEILEQFAIDPAFDIQEG